MYAPTAALKPIIANQPFTLSAFCRYSDGVGGVITSTCGSFACTLLGINKKDNRLMAEDDMSGRHVYLKFDV